MKNIPKRVRAPLRARVVVSEHFKISPRLTLYRGRVGTVWGVRERIRIVSFDDVEETHRIPVRVLKKRP